MKSFVDETQESVASRTEPQRVATRRMALQTAHIKFLSPLGAELAGTLVNPGHSVSPVSCSGLPSVADSL